MTSTEKRKFLKSRRYKLVLVLLIFGFLMTGAIITAMGEGGGGSGGEGGEGPGGGGNQTQDQNGNGTGNSEQNQEENGNGTQNQEQNQEQNGGCNCTCSCNGSGNETQNQEQNQNGTQNQEQNGGCGCNGSGNETQNQEQNGGCDGNKSRNQEQKQDCSCNCTCGCKMYKYKWYGENGVCVSKHEGGGDGNGSQWRHRYQNQIQEGAQNGTLIMETTFRNQNRYLLQENNHYSLGMEIELLEVTKNKVRVRVRAEFSEGKVVALNIEENVLRFGNSENVRIRFDGERIQRGSVEQVMAAKGEQARYVEEVGEGGSQFLVYIPHFSEHIIEIESLFEEELFTGTNYAVMGISIVALIALSGNIYKIGKSRM